MEQNTNNEAVVKETITFTVKETTEKEVEIKLPYFSKHRSLDNYYKVFGTGAWDAIRVENGDNELCLGISLTVSSTALTGTYSECTEEEFIQAYKGATQKLKDILNG